MRSRADLARYSQHFVVIPKSVSKARIVDNSNVFDFTLEKEDIDHLTSLDEFLITVSLNICLSLVSTLTIQRSRRTGK